MDVLEQRIIWDQKLIEKYNYSGPRYTSYPTALEFNEHYREADFRQAINKYPAKNLTLYIHIPFCHKLCYFCGCNKIITRHTEKADRYLDILEQEIRSRAALFGDRLVSQMHWGGGTPTYLSAQQINRLMNLLRENFNFAQHAELSIEIDPREIELSMLDHLLQEGFTRISMGVQDFNKAVQQVINREQDEDFIFALMQRARELNFQSTNIDLIYGLPKQTSETFFYTLQKVIELNPDRLSVFNYAHLPDRFAAQRKINELDLPSVNERLAILQNTITILTKAGYHFIGMDHFARANDELALAQRQGILHRNFQGYTTQGDNDLLGLGVSAISMLGDSYAQNVKKLNQYYASIVQQGYALERGFTMSKDDCLRRDVIKALICNFTLDYSMFEQIYDITFSHYFAEELELLNIFAIDELIMFTDRGINVTAKGRLLIRNICMCFDLYMRRLVRQRQFSRVI